jgi:hypothetical protein
MEPTEIHEFSEHMKEAGEATESGRESLTQISLSISILAVLVAMVTVMGHRTHTHAIIEQTRAADLWNWYQAKKIRMEDLTVTSEILTLQPSINAEATAARVADYHKQIEKWQEELKENQKEGDELEAEVNHAERQATRFDLGEALLQVAVVLASVTLFTRNRGYYFLGLSLGAVGLLIAVTGFFLR